MKMKYEIIQELIYKIVKFNKNFSIYMMENNKFFVSLHRKCDII